MDIQRYDGDKLVCKLAQEIKKVPECKMPEWAMFVKTGVNKDRPPMEEDWWYMRAASILRKVSILGPVGVNKLRRKYGGKYRRGYKPSTFTQGSGKIIRVILQQLETSGLVKQIVVSGHKGRVIGTKGIKLMATAAKELKVEKAPVKEVKETKAKAPKKEVKGEAVSEDAKADAKVVEAKE